MLTAEPAVLGVLAVLASLALLAPVFAAGATLAVRFLGPVDHLALIGGVLAVGLAAYLSFLAHWAGAVWGGAVSLVLLLGSVVWLVIVRAWRWWRVALRCAVLFGGVALVALGMLFLWESPANLQVLAAMRYNDALPIDNAIPQLFAERLLSGESTHALVGDWNGSDRPPLQSGLILILMNPIGVWSGVAEFANGASVLAQLLWVPALAALLRALGVSTRATVLAIVFVAVTGSTLLNTVYTWPKLLSAALVLASAALLVDARRNPQRFRVDFVLAVLAFVLGALAHGAAGFALPFVVLLGILAYRGQRPARVLGTTAVAGLLGLAVYAPWMLYQRFVDPPGDRLLKWHLAGVLDPSDPRGPLETIVDSYRSLSLQEWWDGRVANLLALVWNSARGPDCDACGPVLGELRLDSFFSTAGAIGLAGPAVVVVGLLIALRVLRGRGAGEPERAFVLLTVGAVLSMLFWALAMYLPGSTVVHQGSHVWILLLLAAPMVWLAETSRPLALALLAAQAVLTAAVFGAPQALAPLDPVGAAVLAIGLALLVVALVDVLRRRTSAAEVTA